MIAVLKLMLVIALGAIALVYLIAFIAFFYVISEDNDQ